MSIDTNATVFRLSTMCKVNNSKQLQIKYPPLAQENPVNRHTSLVYKTNSKCFIYENVQGWLVPTATLLLCTQTWAFFMDEKGQPSLSSSMSLVLQVSDFPPHSNKCRQLQPQTLPQFLVSLYEYDPADETKDVFHEISIHRYRCIIPRVHKNGPLE